MGPKRRQFSAERKARIDAEADASKVTAGPARCCVARLSSLRCSWRGALSFARTASRGSLCGPSSASTSSRARTAVAHAASSRSSPTQSSCARSSPTSDCPPSRHGPHRRAHANSSTSPESRVPYASEHASRPGPAPASGLGRIENARATAPTRVARLASRRAEARARIGRPLDESAHRGAPPSRGRRRPPPAEVIRLEFLSAPRGCRASNWSLLESLGKSLASYAHCPPPPHGPCASSVRSPRASLSPPRARYAPAPRHPSARGTPRDSSPGDAPGPTEPSASSTHAWLQRSLQAV